MKKIKYILLISALLISITQTQAHAQKKNSLRAGPGVNLTTWESYSNWVVGPSLYMEYTRKFNRFFSIAAGGQLYGLIYDKWCSQYEVYSKVSGLARPFAFIKWLDWIETGVGFFGKYSMFSEDRSGFIPIGGEYRAIFEMRQSRSISTGLEIPVRFYMIDNDKFECFAFVNFDIGIYSSGMNWDYLCCGVMFGVKF